MISGRAAMIGRRFGVLVLTSLTLSGCATRWNYSKAGADTAQMELDREQCAQSAHAPFGSKPIELAEGRVWSFPFETVDPKALNECMVNKGYTLDPVTRARRIRSSAGSRGPRAASARPRRTR